MNDKRRFANLDAAPQNRSELWPDAPGAPAFAAFSTTHLRFLITIAGPEDAAALVDSLLRDLARLQILLADAGNQLDWPRIQEQAEILISISASIGADSLIAAGRALYCAAENRLPGLLLARLPATLRAIAALHSGIRDLMSTCQSVS